jgi:hypothetical protein
MRRTIAAIALFCLLSGLAPALEIKNVRPSYGPMGASRTATKFLPGDVLWINYDIDGLTFDKKTDKASYETKLEFFDAKGTQLLERKTPNEVTAQLGGSQFPGDLHVIIGPKLDPGKYTVKLTVTDKLARESKSITYPIEVLPPAFGFVAVTAPGLGLPGQHYLAEFGVVGFKLDDKKKEPNVEVTIRVLDSSQKPVTRPVQSIFPRDLPGDAVLEKLQFVPVTFPLYLNRPGHFYIDITAVDKNAGNKQIQLRYPLQVLDLGVMTGGK